MDGKVQSIGINNIEENESILIYVDTSKVTLDAMFMQWEPRNIYQKKVKELIENAIKAQIKPFYRTKYDPSFDKNGNICFLPGKKPAVERSYRWWRNTAENYCPELGSRLGTRLEYAMFLGFLMNELLETGKSIDWVWESVCEDSYELGHYRNSADAVLGFETTGSRRVVGFCDLANTFKVLADDYEREDFWAAGSCYWNSSYLFPIGAMYHSDRHFDVYDCSVGWFVFSKAKP